MIFNNPREINIKPLNVGMIWLNFRNSNNFFKLSVVKPTIINGITIKMTSNLTLLPKNVALIREPFIYVLAEFVR